jgi:hypothetical protein
MKHKGTCSHLPPRWFFEDTVPAGMPGTPLKKYYADETGHKYKRGEKLAASRDAYGISRPSQISSF